MGWSRLPKYAEVDPDNPRAWGTCDRCGFVNSLHKMQFQFQYQGTSTPENTGYIVCDRCLDALQPQLSPPIVPPDPMPVFNARVENYSIDEDSYIATQDTGDMFSLNGDQLTTQDDEIIVTDIPNPDSSPDTP